MKQILFFALLATLAFAGTTQCPCPDTHFWHIAESKCVQYNYKCTKQVINDWTQQFSCKECEDGFVPKYGKCIPLTIEFCLQGELEGNDKEIELCTQCQEGKFHTLDRTSCISNPLESSPDHIPNCSVYRQYTDRVICEKCAPNFYKESQQECIPYPTSGENFVVGCPKYTKRFEKYQCQYCAEDHSKGIKDGACVPVTEFDPQCIKAGENDDMTHCIECSEGYYYRSDTNSCARNPQSENDRGFNGNCLSYKLLSFACATCESKIACKKCKDGWVYDSETYGCKQLESPIENCDDYKYNRFEKRYKCIMCKNDFWFGKNTSENYKCLQCPSQDDVVYVEPTPPNQPSDPTNPVIDPTNPQDPNSPGIPDSDPQNPAFGSLLKQSLLIMFIIIIGLIY